MHVCMYIKDVWCYFKKEMHAVVKANSSRIAVLLS